MFSRVGEPEGAAYVQSQCPRVKAWVERCSKAPVVLKARCGLNFDPRLPANCAAMQKMVGKYFKHQADLLPSFVNDVLAPYDAFASGSAPLLAFETFVAMLAALESSKNLAYSSNCAEMHVSLMCR